MENMIQVIIKCYDKGYELKKHANFPALPHPGDIIEHDEKEYEVKFCSFSTKFPSVVEVVVEIQ